MLIFYDFEVSKLCVFDDDLEEYIKLNKAYAEFMKHKVTDSSYSDDYSTWLAEAEEDMEKEM